jgi:hypothetical protein
VRRVAIPTGILLCFVTAYASGCGQTEQPPVVARTTSLNAPVTDNDAPRQRMAFELRQAMTFDRTEAQKQGAHEKRSLKSVTTDSAGMLRFGEVRTGRYLDGYRWGRDA